MAQIPNAHPIYHWPVCKLRNTAELDVRFRLLGISCKFLMSYEQNRTCSSGSALHI